MVRINMAVQKFTSSSSVTDWPIVCILASQNPLILKNFRSFSIVKEIIDGYPDYAVYQYLYRIKTITGKNFKSFLNEVVFFGIECMRVAIHRSSCITFLFVVNVDI